jgi:hypothetical protein
VWAKYFQVNLREFKKKMKNFALKGYFTAEMNLLEIGIESKIVVIRLETYADEIESQ